MAFIEKVVEQLSVQEGFRDRPYKDRYGNLTIGYGHNLDAKAMSKRALTVQLEDDVKEAWVEVISYLPWASALDDARLAVIVNMAFNLGIEGFIKKNPKMLAAVQTKDYNKAADEMLDGNWKTQVGKRAYDLAQQMRTGIWQI